MRNALEIHIPDDGALVDSTMDRLKRLIVGVEFGEWVTVDSFSDPSCGSELARESFGKCRRRAASYMKALLPLAATEVLFVGYQVKGTLGRQLLQATCGEHIRIDGQTIELRAECFSVSGFSAHADQDLLAFIEGMVL